MRTLSDDRCYNNQTEFAHFSDFTPKVRDVTANDNVLTRQKKAEKGPKSQAIFLGNRLQIPGGHEPDGYTSSSSGDELIEEAESFLTAVRESKDALVSVEEWSVKRDKKVCSVRCRFIIWNTKLQFSEMDTRPAQSLLIHLSHPMSTLSCNRSTLATAIVPIFSHSCLTPPET